MLDLKYRVDVESPCSGNQEVTKVGSTHYAGSAGDFTHVILTRAPSATAWEVKVYDYTSAGPCAPTTTFEQATPNASDPIGVYWKVGANGPDQSLGVATVSDWS